jgi:hypothetical protein
VYANSGQYPTQNLVHNTGPASNLSGQNRGGLTGVGAVGPIRNGQSLGPGNVQASSSSSVSGLQGAPASSKNCYKCGLPGHGVKDCKTILYCIYCGKNTHISGNCVLPSQPKPAAALIGGGADGLQMFTSLTSKRIDAEKSK